MVEEYLPDSEGRADIDRGDHYCLLTTIAVGALLAGANDPIPPQEALAGNGEKVCREAATEEHSSVTEKTMFTPEEPPEGSTGVGSRLTLTRKRIPKGL